MNKEQALENVIKDPMNNRAWKALGEACGWKYGDERIEATTPMWIDKALGFYGINLTDGRVAAVQWLEELVG